MTQSGPKSPNLRQLIVPKFLSLRQTSEKLEYGRRVIYAGCPFFVLASEDGHIPTF